VSGAPFPFVAVVAASRDLVVTSSHEHACRLEPRKPGLAWHCDLDDGTPTGETDPASYVRWVCPELRIRGSATDGATPVIDVHRSGPRSDLGKLMNAFRGLIRHPSPRQPGGVEERYVYTDPAGILDSGLRSRIETWPSAPHGDGVVRPAELGAIKLTHEGLIVESASWWDSAPALDHQIGLAVDIASRLMARR
jgi:hypothetical protein